MDDHWLVRRGTIRILWGVFIAVLALTVLAGGLVHREPHFAIEALFAFDAWFGFAACAALIFGAKAIGLLLKRRDDYYREVDGDD
jgi:hypothetical protein